MLCKKHVNLGVFTVGNLIYTRSPILRSFNTLAVKIIQNFPNNGGKR
jgi:hypothetical protein